ncbi:MAG: hypothetical protein ABI691_07830 [Ginsengibacter sp.]
MKKSIILSLIIFVAIVIFSLLQKSNWHFSSTTENIFIGLLTSASVVLFLEIAMYLRSENRYAYFKGNFIRTDIYNKLEERKNDKIYESIMPRYNSRLVSTLIKIKHSGEGRFIGIADYEEGSVEFEIFLDSINPSYGEGTYQYLHKHEGYLMPDFGTLKLIRDKVDLKRIYIYYNNIASSGLAEGYEIWEKE